MRAFLFVMVGVLVNQLLVFCLMPAGAYTRLMMHELYTTQEDLDLVFSGSSLAYPHFNPEIIDADMNVRSFNTGSSMQSLPGNYTVLKEMFAHHSPRYVILTTEWVNYTQREENVMVYLSLIPYIRNPLSRLEYFWNTARQGSVRNRIFWWTGYHVNSIKDLLGNIQEKLFDQAYRNYEYITYTSEAYRGRGFVYKYTPVYDPDTYGVVKRSGGNIDTVTPENLELMGKIVELCRENDCQLILINPPRVKLGVLSIRNYFELDAYISSLAESYEVPYYNFNLAKPEFLFIPDNCFSDYAHMTGEGADLFSHAFSKLMLDREADRNVEDYFYTPEEFLASVDYITNTWFLFTVEDNTLKISADSLYGSLVTPEYQILIYDEKDQLVDSREYSPESDWQTQLPEGEYRIRVNARCVGNDAEYERYYEERAEI